MKKITDKQLANIIGGEASVLVYVVVSAVIAFVAGIIEGYTNPRACNNKYADI